MSFPLLLEIIFRTFRWFVWCLCSLVRRCPSPSRLSFSLCFAGVSRGATWARSPLQFNENWSSRHEQRLGLIIGPRAMNHAAINPVQTMRESQATATRIDIHEPWTLCGLTKKKNPGRHQPQGHWHGTLAHWDTNRSPEGQDHARRTQEQFRFTGRTKPPTSDKLNGTSHQ